MAMAQKTRRPPHRALTRWPWLIPSLALAVWVAWTLPPSTARAAHPHPPRVDLKSGKDLEQWPPDPLFTRVHMDLAIDIPTLDEPAFSGVLTLRKTAVADGLSSIRLDARDTLTIRAVRADGRSARFTHRDNVLTILLPTALRHGQDLELQIEYTALRPFADGAGLVWLPREGPRPEQAPQVYSQGQANYNSYWFPCHDFPNLRLTSHVSVTAPAEYTVISNGRLVGRTEHAGRATTRYAQDLPHVAYLVMIAVGRFDVVELGGPDSARPGLSMPVYGPPGSAERLRAIFRQTPRMMAMFERLFDMPYPWDKYAQIVVRQFAWGGMENTSATILSPRVLTGRPGDHDDLIAHELAHQWFGNLVTCRSWEHLWINEGWATLAEWLWAGERDGQTAYFRAMQAARDHYLDALSRANGPLTPMVSRLYHVPDEVFEKTEDPYIRGAMVLHMLREFIGEDAFWRGARLFLKRFRTSGLAGTADLCAAFEEASGRSLERFFHQWCHRAGVPTLRVQTSWEENLQVFTVRVEQLQPISDTAPAYDLCIPIYLGDVTAALTAAPPSGLAGDPPPGWLFIRTDQRVTTRSVPLPKRPSQVHIDPRGAVLARYQDR